VGIAGEAAFGLGVGAVLPVSAGIGAEQNDLLRIDKLIDFIDNRASCKSS
jgi:hypothetical protein